MTLRSRLAALALALAAPAVGAQPFTTLQQDAAVSAPDLARLSAGGAVAALPTLDSPFLSNPAHITATDGFSLTIAGAAVGVGGNLRESYTFYDERLGPAIEEGLDEIRETDPERLEALYREALLVGRQQKMAEAAVVGPSLRLRTGPVSVGAGVYGRAVSRAKILDGGAGLPYVDLYGQADVFAPVVVGVDLDRTPLGLFLPARVSLGASATYLQRRVTAKGEPVDAIDPDAEKLYVLRGEGVRLALGAWARDVVVPGLDLGAEVTNLGAPLTHELETSWAVSGSGDAPDDAAEVAALQARFDGRADDPAVRVGAAYRVPTVLVPGLADVAVTADYTTASTSEFDQSAQAGLRAGAQARLAGLFEVRAGVSQGMPSAGVALATRVLRIGYATYGVEDGRLLGQLQRRSHVVQVRFGLF